MENPFPIGSKVASDSVCCLVKETELDKHRHHG